MQLKPSKFTVLSVDSGWQCAASADAIPLVGMGLIPFPLPHPVSENNHA